MELYYESMTKVVFQLHPWEQIVIRCWRYEPDYKGEETESQNMSDIMATLNRVDKDESNNYSIANHLIALERMNAVEVLDQQGHGLVVYKDWP